MFKSNIFSRIIQECYSIFKAVLKNFFLKSNFSISLITWDKSLKTHAQVFFGSWKIFENYEKFWRQFLAAERSLKIVKNYWDNFWQLKDLSKLWKMLETIFGTWNIFENYEKCLRQFLAAVVLFIYYTHHGMNFHSCEKQTFKSFGCAKTRNDSKWTQNYN